MQYLQQHCKNTIFANLYKMNIKFNWDALGIITSVACAIHCAVLPIVISSLPILGINIIHNAYFEWAMILIAFFVGIYSLRHGYIKHHRSRIPVSFFTVGFIFLLLKQFLLSAEFIFLVFAVAFILTAHFINYRMCNKLNCATPAN